MVVCITKFNDEVVEINFQEVPVESFERCGHCHKHQELYPGSPSQFQWLLGLLQQICSA